MLKVDIKKDLRVVIAFDQSSCGIFRERIVCVSWKECVYIKSRVITSIATNVKIRTILYI
jgi:hypothetical protein